MQADGLPLHGLSTEAIALYLLLGIPLAALLGFLVIARYRRAVARLMVAVGPPLPAGPERSAGGHAARRGRLDLAVVGAGDTAAADRGQRHDRGGSVGLMVLPTSRPASPSAPWRRP